MNLNEIISFPIDPVVQGLGVSDLGGEVGEGVDGAGFGEVDEIGLINKSRRHVDDDGLGRGGGRSGVGIV